ncbi:CRISPR-associated endonuclease Cas2 [Candidatus Bathyarchaeota archaeon]|nr:CRISPR-associated endonuclease Cas2 [Candidatus Bathyarchaeota archaeon]
MIYDITDDNLRLQVAETLKDYGLAHIQYSAFIGDLRRDRLNSLIVDLRRLIGDAVENVQIYPLCDSCFRGRRIIGKPKRYGADKESGRPRFIYF